MGLKFMQDISQNFGNMCVASQCGNACKLFEKHAKKLGIFGQCIQDKGTQRIHLVGLAGSFVKNYVFIVPRRPVQAACRVDFVSGLWDGMV